MPALLPGPDTRSPLGKEHHTDAGIVRGGILKTRVAKATHIEEGDAQVVYAEFVLAPSFGFVSLSSVEGFFFSPWSACIRLSHALCEIARS